MKNRLEGLDGLRGVAAILILLHHVELLASNHYWLIHGYLAVDLFFVLSGFVVSHAYEVRFDNGLSFSGFVLHRMIRLYPLIFLGATLGVGAAAYLANRDHLLLLLIMQLLFVPDFWSGRDLFLLNGVQWSLLFELFANFVHRALYKTLSVRVLVGILAASFPLLAVTSWYFEGLGVGWGAANFVGGIPRVIFSYTAGMLLFRLFSQRLLPRVTISWPVLASTPLVLILIARPTGWIGDIFVVLSFPFLVWLGLFVKLPLQVARFASFFGFISYPLYAIHGALLQVASPWLVGLPMAPRILGCTILIVIVVTLSWAVGRFYDQPVRNYLTRLFGKQIRA